MTKKRLVLLITGVILVIAVSGGLFALANGEGTETDPLITKSYLEDIFQPQVESLIDSAVSDAAKAEKADLDKLLIDYKNQISARVEEFNAETGGSLDNAAYAALLEEAVRERLAGIEVTPAADGDIFRTVKLANGQTLYCSEGAEFFIRSGSVKTTGEFLNVPSASVASKGAKLGTNTLYVAPGSSSGILATSDTTVFIRGGYTVK